MSRLLSAIAAVTCVMLGLAEGRAAPATQPTTQPVASPAMKTSFYGTGGQAQKIVYLIDASGSLIDTLDFVILELKRSIGELREEQSFTVLFYQGDDVIEVAGWSGPQPATEENKARAMEWIDPKEGNVIPRGIAAPIRGLTRALGYQPELLYFLTPDSNPTGRMVDPGRVLAEIEKSNTAGTKINTIQFLYPDPLTGQGIKGTLEQISERTGGIYKFLDAKELGIR